MELQKICITGLLSFALILLCGFSLSECKQRKYNGDKILRVKVSNQKAWQNVESVMKKYTAEDDIWSSPVALPSFGDIRVSPQEYEIVTSQLKKFGLDFKVFIEDVQKFIDAQNADSSNAKSQPFRQKRATMSNQIVGTYASYDEIVKYIYDAEENFEIASVINIGDSLEGRPLLVLKLGIPHPDPQVVKPVIWIDSAIHAREWIAPASLMYIIYQLLNGYHEKDPVIFDLLKRVDWMFLPVVNPDGYVYSFSDERLWRKNRASINGSDCLGVDLNRNFDFHWGEETASEDPCHVMYRGETAASEPETQLVQQFLVDNREAIFVYISLHSYSQYWFSRWAYTDEKVETHDEMYGLAKRATDALNDIHGTDFRAGRPFELLYGYSGGSADYAYGAGIPYSYTIELRDKGQYGFLLPTEEIIPQGQELYAGILVVAEHIKNISKVDFSFLETYEVKSVTPDDVNHFHFKENDLKSGTQSDAERDTDESTLRSIQDGYGRQGQTTSVLMNNLFTLTELPNVTATIESQTVSHLDTTSHTQSSDATAASDDVKHSKDDVTRSNGFHPPRGFRNSASKMSKSFYHQAILTYSLIYIVFSQMCSFHDF